MIRKEKKKDEGFNKFREFCAPLDNWKWIGDLETLFHSLIIRSALSVAFSFLNRHALGWMAGVEIPSRARDILHSTASIAALGPTELPIQWVPRALSPVVRSIPICCFKLYAHVYFVRNSRMVKLYFQSLLIIHITNKLPGQSPLANYTDWATSSCWWSRCQIFLYKVPRGQRDGSLLPYSRFSRPEPLLFLSSRSSVVLTRPSGPRSRPSTSQKV
jgi:hypothetical protein